MAVAQEKLHHTGNELDLCIRLFQALHAEYSTSSSAPFMIGEPRPAVSLHHIAAHLHFASQLAGGEDSSQPLPDQLQVMC